MTFVIPFEKGPEFQIPGVFKVASTPKNRLIAMMTADSIYIVDSSIREMKDIKYKLTRNKESYDSYGENQWIQWIDNTTICFGTATHFFFSAINDKEIQVLTSAIPINGCVLSTFSCFKYLGLVYPDSTIDFFDVNGEKISTFALPRNVSPLTSVEFQRPSTLTGISGNSPFILYLERNVIENNGEYIYHYINEDSAVLSAYNPYYSLIAYVTNKSEVFTIGMTSNFTKKVQLVNSSQGIISKLQWVNKGKVLLVFYQSGCCVCFFIETGRHVSLTFKEFENIVDLTVDAYQQMIFVTDYSKVTTIYLAESSESVLFTPIGFSDFLTDVQFRTMSTGKLNLPEDAYPIRKIIKKDKDSYLIYNETGFCLLNNYKSSDFVHCSVMNAAFVNNHIFIFTSDLKILIYDLLCRKVSDFELGYLPKHVSVYQEKLCVSCEDKYTTFTVKNNNGKYEFAKQKTMKSKVPLKGVFLLENSTLIYSADDVIYESSSQTVLGEDQRSAFTIQTPSAIFMLCGSQTVLGIKNVTFKFSEAAYFADEINFYTIHVKDDRTLSITMKNYLASSLSYISKYPDRFLGIYNNVKDAVKEDVLLQNFADAVNISIEKSRLDQCIVALQKLPDEFAYRSIIEALKKCKAEERLPYYDCSKIIWKKLAKFVNEEDYHFFEDAPSRIKDIIFSKN